MLLFQRKGEALVVLEQNEITVPGALNVHLATRGATLLHVRAPEHLDCLVLDDLSLSAPLSHEVHELVQAAVALASRRDRSRCRVCLCV